MTGHHYDPASILIGTCAAGEINLACLGQKTTTTIKSGIHSGVVTVISWPNPHPVLPSTSHNLSATNWDNADVSFDVLRDIFTSKMRVAYANLLLACKKKSTWAAAHVRLWTRKMPRYGDTLGNSFLICPSS